MNQPVFEFYSSNEFREYPFDARRSDGLHELFVDAYVMHTAERTNPGRLRVESFDPSGSLSLRFENGTLLGSLVGADNFVSSPFGRFTLYEWRKSVAYGVGFVSWDLIARLVAVTSRLADFSFPVTPPGAYLLSSRVNPRLKTVVSMAVALPESPCCLGGPRRNAVQLEAGYNTDISLRAPEVEVGLALEEETEVREPTDVTLAASAGLGRGTYPVCEDPSQYVRSINNVLPDDLRDFRIELADCTWEEARLVGGASPPVHPNTDYLSSIIDGTNRIILQLHQACRACCDCADYGRAYQQMKTTWERALAVRNRLLSVTQDFNDLVDSWKDEKTSREKGMEIRIRAVARPDFHVSIAVQVGNSSDATIVPTALSIAVGSGAEYTPRSGYAELEGLHNYQLDPSGTPGGPYAVTMPYIAPGQYAIYRLAVRYTGSNRANALKSIDVTATSGATVRTETKQVKLLGPLVKS